MEPIITPIQHLQEVILLSVQKLLMGGKEVGDQPPGAIILEEPEVLGTGPMVMQALAALMGQAVAVTQGGLLLLQLMEEQAAEAGLLLEEPEVRGQYTYCGKELL